MNDRQVGCAAPIRGPAEMDRLKEIDSHLLAIANDFAASPRQYPALIPKEALDQAEYPQAFPHLLLSAAALRDPAAKLPFVENLAAPVWCLSPAVCYHVYHELAHQQFATGRCFTARGRCFRQESEFIPGTRQIEFEMREIVWIGSANWVAQQLAEGRERFTTLTRELNLPGEWIAAEDPFFLPAAQGKAYLQRLQETKFEYQSQRDPIALASINRHGAFFGSRFAITDGRGEPVHTACLAIGLDRCLARFSGDVHS
jgi:hypothetical protein